MHFVGVLKIIFVLSLFLIFLFVFGKPSLEKYLKKETIFVESKVKFDERKPPALTVMNTNPHLYVDLQHCLSNGSYDFVVECYNKHFVKRNNTFDSTFGANLSWVNYIPVGEYNS